jgi:hypothetical protein
VKAVVRGVKSLHSRGVVLGIVRARRTVRSLVGMAVRQVAAGGRCRASRQQWWLGQWDCRLDAAAPAH